ncbi:MAG: aldehyde ferredoxin oxidoreductase family protein [Candidatus Bathyarchaeota archaeon]|nr:aldehyde ferredoxin oxidoreductase family protein [Candidatus Bathyarchaeota archaeon]
MFGYAGKMLRVDLTSGQIQYDTLKEEMINSFLGGAGFATSIIYNEVPPLTPSLSPQNKLVFAIGPVTGTRWFGSSRWVVASKSPLTGIWGEADSGGFWAAELKHAGFDAIVVEGASDKPVFLWVSDGKAEIRDAKGLWGLTTTETEREIKSDCGRRTRVVSIGPGAENLVRFACVIESGHAAGRSGMGCVMGYKKLKAIAAVGDGMPEVADPDELKKLRDQWVEARLERVKARTGMTTLRAQYGRGAHLERGLERHNLPLGNWSLDDWGYDSARAISTDTMAETVQTGMRVPTCWNCPVHSDTMVKIESGPFAVEECVGPEYETLASYGSLLLNDNLESICKANDLCNRYSMDTIEAGTTIAMAIECYENGILTKEDTGGIELTWGNSEAIVEITEMIARRKGFGMVLAEGVKKASEIIGKGADKYAMHVKGSSICEHDPRINPPLALKYATLPMGAYHGKGCPDIPVEATSTQVIERQNIAEVVDSLGVCGATSGRFFSPDRTMTFGFVPDILKAVTGIDFDERKLMEIGERIFTMKRAYITKLGVSRKDDRLPARFSEIPRVVEGVELLADVESLLPSYYNLRGWDENGIPTIDKLNELGIKPL